MDNKITNILVALFCGLLWAGCGEKPSSVVPAHTSSTGGFQTSWVTESQFIVERTARDLVEIIHLAAGQPANELEQYAITAKETTESQFGSPSFHVAISHPGRSINLAHSLHISTPIWSAETFLGLAGEFSELFQLKPSSPANWELTEDKALRELVELNVNTIEKWNQHAALMLNGDLLAPIHHELAALVLGVFMLRDHSGYFREIRTPLCRMTAHLTMAALLHQGGQPSLNGRMAEVVLATLIGNQHSALGQLKALPDSGALKPWQRALQAMNTFDYRPLQSERNLTLIEKFALFQAEATSIDIDTAWERIGSRQALAVADFVRIANSQRPSVGLGHELIEVAVPLEFQEMSEYFEAARMTVSDESEITEFLNRWPDGIVAGATGTPPVQVIGPGLWASFFHRHLSHALTSGFDFLKFLLGDPAAAADWASFIEERYSSLNFAPFIKRITATTMEAYKTTTESGIDLMLQRPHLIPAMCWNYFYWQPDFASQPYHSQRLPDVSAWHSHNPPPHTVYDLEPRLTHRSLMTRSDTGEQLKRLLERAPYNFELTRQLVRHVYGDNSTYLQIRSWYEPMTGFSGLAVLELLDSGGLKAEEYERLAAPLAPLMPDLYLKLGNQFAEVGDEARAVRYFEKGIETSKDSVAISNNAGWLIQYYHRNGESRKAHQLADFAAEVYSYRGLQAKADLLFAEKKYEEAITYHRRILDRYDSPRSLVKFYMDYKRETGLSTYDDLAAKHIEESFSLGPKKVQLGEFSGPPKQGVYFGAENEQTRKHGFQKGDVVVAINGYAIATPDDWHLAKALGKTDEMTMILWNGSQYRQLTANPPGLMFGVSIHSYRSTP